MKPKVKLVNVTKDYKFYNKTSEKLLDLLSLNRNDKKFKALNNVSFEVFKGESIGIVGVNGSGKSTLSNVLAEIISPTKGDVRLEGKSSLIAISAGLNKNLSGIENIEVKCLMLGMKKKDIKLLLPSIIEFADIGEFIHQPVKNYSSGMRSRLGFAISAYTKPDILIIDEALSVGDQTFYNKCMQKIDEFKQEGKTIFFISHSIGQVRSFADKVLWLHYGRVKMFGERTEVLNHYGDFVKWFNSLNHNEKKTYRKEMLEEQFKSFSEKSEYDIDMPRKNKNKKLSKNVWIKKKFFGFFQLAVLFVGLISSGALLLNSNTIINKNVNDNQQALSSNEEKQGIESEIINSEALISTNVSYIYKTLNTMEVIDELKFSDPVLVREEKNGRLLIEYDGKLGYIDAANIQIIKSEYISDIKFEKILELTPDLFAQAYMFFLSYIGMTDAEIISKFKENSQRIVNEYGEKSLYFDSSHIRYNLDNSNIARGITIFNINTNNSYIDNLIDKSILKNENQGMYFLETKDYSLIINLKAGSITVKNLD